jgi:hypothetical protein
MPADARIRADALAYMLDVGTHLFGDVGDLVHETDLGRQHRVGRVLGQLGGTHVHRHDAVVVAVERRVQALERRHRRRVVGTDDDAVRAHAVLDRSALLQEFGIGHHVEGDGLAARFEFGGDRRAHLVGGTDRHRGLVDDHRRLAQVLADGTGDRQHVAAGRRCRPRPAACRPR